MPLKSTCLGLLLTVFAAVASAQEAPAKIAWYGTLKAGLDEAKRSGRPILFVSGAPQCLGVSGIW